MFEKKRSSPKLKRFFRPKSVALQKKKRTSPTFKRFSRPKLGDLRKKKGLHRLWVSSRTKKHSTFLVQITPSPSQLLLSNPAGGLFSFLEQNSASKALKTCYFAYFSGQWEAVAPPPSYATERADVSRSINKKFISFYKNLPSCYFLRFKSIVWALFFFSGYVYLSFSIARP